MKKIILATLLITLVGCSGGRNSTGYSLINDMIHSEAVEAFAENNTFENGQAMQEAPANTIPRGFMPHPMDDSGNAVVLNNPYEMTDYTWKRGQILYNKTCSACHGIKGRADGLVVKKGGFPKPPKFKSRSFKYSKKNKKPAGHIFNVITFGSGNMPSHAQQLYAEDRWYVSEYVRERLMVKGKK